MSSKPPLISVVMLNYNGLKYLKRTIPPILKLDYPNYEFIIVDNGSTDGSVKFIKKFKKIKLIKNGENLGYSQGKNIGVKHAKGKYILLLDNDIYIDNKSILKEGKNNIYSKEFLTFVLTESRHKKTQLYGGYFNLFGIAIPRKVSLHTINRHKDIIYCGFPHGQMIFFLKKDWNNFFGGYDERQPYMLDDNDLGMRGWILGYKFKVLNGGHILDLGAKTYKNDEKFIWKTKYYFSGFSTSMFKNYNYKNLFKYYPFFILYSLLKTIKNIIVRRRFRIILSYFSSINLFLKNLPDTLKQRKIIQSKRIIKDDIFLKIKPPKFD